MGQPVKASRAYSVLGGARYDRHRLVYLPDLQERSAEDGRCLTLRGIRTSADQIIEKWEAGEETIDIAEMFDLDLNDVGELLAFAQKAPRLAHSV